jgi:hypothetical protein
MRAEKTKIFTTVLMPVLAFLLWSCGGKENASEGKKEGVINPATVEYPVSASGSGKGMVPVFEFTDTIHDFGKIVDGEKVSYAFRFKNSGNGDLIIRAANGSCGCTVPEYPKEPIAPGGGGVITVTFDSKGRAGMQSKTVSLIANTIPNTTTLSITAEVLSSR